MENGKQYYRGWNQLSSEHGFNWIGGPGELMRERQIRRRLTYQQLADQVRVVAGLELTANDIAMFEAKQLEPSEEQMQALAVAMGLDPNWFVGEWA